MTFILPSRRLTNGYEPYHNPRYNKSFYCHRQDRVILVGKAGPRIDVTIAKPCDEGGWQMYPYCYFSINKALECLRQNNALYNFSAEMLK